MDRHKCIEKEFCNVISELDLYCVLAERVWKEGKQK